MKEADLTMFQQAFFEEAAELLDELEAKLLELDERVSQTLAKGGSGRQSCRVDDAELLNTIFRCAHSIKGSGATFGFAKIAAFTHEVETLLERLRSNVIEASGDLCKVLFDSLDQMRALLAEARDLAGPAPDDRALLARISALAGSSASPVVCSETAEVASGATCRYELVFKPGFDVMRTGCDPCHLLGQVAQLANVLDVQRDDADIPDLDALDPEGCYVGWKLLIETDATADEILEVFDFVIDDSEVSLTPVSASTQGSLEPAFLEKQAEGATESKPKVESSVLRVSAEKVDKLINLVGELVIAQAMLNEAVGGLEFDHHPRLEEALNAVERTSRELQERVMGIRLVQLKHALGRFPRLVHDLSRSIGKKIELTMVGEETELDKNLIEALGDPLTHLVRNCVDHGLETVAERVAAGKPEVGSLRIVAQYEGGNVVIEVSDDGRGLNRERILAKARQNGLVSETDNLSDDAVYNLIFAPGFSTAEKVTDLSGRGVGMDIVRQAIRGMNGAITIHTRPGLGSSFRIRLPLTLAILEGLSVRVGEEVYVMPLTSIVESFRPMAQDVMKLTGQHEVVRVRGEILRILRLHDFFRVDGAIANPCEGLLVIVENEGEKVALLVDELITQNQAVIKSLEANYRKVPGVMGATILGDGRVALIIDVPGLLQDKQAEGGRCLAAA